MWCTVIDGLNKSAHFQCLGLHVFKVFSWLLQLLECYLLTDGNRKVMEGTGFFWGGRGDVAG